jgi:sulfur-oxidizing protein SoxY
MRPTRRQALTLSAGAAVSLLAGRGLATPQEAEAEIAAFASGKTPQSGGITLDLPDAAEDGNAVALSVSVDSPMLSDNYVAEVLILADGNPRPRVATFHFTAMSGRAEATTRIRLARSQNVIVLAKTNDGRLLAARKHVAVTIGGCTN